MPQEDEFPTPAAGSHREIGFVAERGAELQLAIQDESGAPIPNARATAWWGVTEATSGKNHVSDTSGPDGRVRLFVRPGALQFRAAAPGFAFAEGDAVAPVAYPVILTKGGRIVGHCLHRGKPMPDFQVIHWQAGPVVVHRSASFLDREDGSFELEDLPPGGWWLLAASPTLPGGAPALVEVRPEETARVELDLPLPIRGGGRIIDQVTGLPVPEAHVQIFAAGANRRSLPWGLPVPVAQDGSFDLDAFVVGPNYLTADADGYASTDVTATAISSDFLDWGDIRLPRPQALRINLLGLESLGCSPTALRVQAATGLEEKHFDTEGRVEYEKVRPGDHEVLIFHPDSSWARLRLRLDSGSDWSYDFKIAGSRALGVRVVEESGKPLPPEAAVILATQEENGVYVVRLCQPWQDGRVRFEGIRSARVQIIVLAVDNETLTSRDLDLTSDDQEVEIRLGDAPFRIRVVDGEGAPVSGAWLSIRTSLADEFVGVADTNLDGWASFKGLPPGGLLLNVGHPSVGTRYSVPIEVASKELEFVLEASGSLQLALADGTESLPGVATRIETASGVTLADARETGSDGIVRYELLGEGNYRLGCRRADCWPVFVDKTLAPDEHASMTVQMRRLADLELVFVNRDGLAVSDLDVDLHSLEFDVPVATWLAEGRVRSEHGLTTDSSGRIRVERLPRGPYEWSVTLGDQTPAGTFDLAPPTHSARILLP